MKNKKLLLIILLSFSLVGVVAYFINYKLNPKEKTWVHSDKIIEKYKRKNVNNVPKFFPINIIDRPEKDDLKDIDKEYILPKIEADQQYIQSFLDSRYSKEDYKIKFNEDSSFEYENKIIKEDVIKLNQSDAIKLGKKFLEELNMLYKDAIVYNVTAKFYSWDMVKSSHVDLYYQDKSTLENSTHKGYYSMSVMRSYNNIPIVGNPYIDIMFNNNGIRSINYDWGEVKIVNKGNFISEDIMLDNFLRRAVKTVDYPIYIKSCFAQVEENDDYSLCYAVTANYIEQPPYYIDTATGKWRYYNFYGTIYDGGNRF